MNNVDQNLLSQPTLKTPEEQSAAGGALRQSRNEAKRPAESEDEENSGATLRQKTFQAKKQEKIKEENEKKSGEDSAPSLADGSAQLLKSAWLGMATIYGFIFGFAWVNLHAFGYAVFGDKLFCPPGEEWIPKSIRAKLSKDQLQTLIKNANFLEKTAIFLMDLAVVILLLLFIGAIAAYFNMSFAKKAVIGTVLVWEGITNWFPSLFK